jgi:hypothetical protein
MAMSLADAGKLLGIPEVTIREHVDRGAPTSATGLLNLVHYAAWLNNQLKSRDPRNDDEQA